MNTWITRIAIGGAITATMALVTLGTLSFISRPNPVVVICSKTDPDCWIGSRLAWDQRKHRPPFILPGEEKAP